MTVLLTFLYVLVCIFLILVVLLQQGKGADLASAFGGASSQTAFGPRGTTTLLHKLTTGAFVLFVLLSLTLAILQGKRQGTVMEGVEAPPATPAATAPEPATDAGGGEEPAGETAPAAAAGGEAGDGGSGSAPQAP